MSERNPTDHRFRSITDTDVRSGAAPAETETKSQTPPPPAGDVAPAPSNPHLRRNVTLGIGLPLAGLALAGGIALLGPKGDVVATGTGTTAEPVKPTPEATSTVERYEGSDFVRTQPLDPALEYLNQLSPTEFAKEAEQNPEAVRRWAAWADQYKTQFMTVYNLVDGGDHPGNEAYTLSKDDFFSMLADLQWQYRIANNFSNGKPANIDTNGPLAINEAKKYLLSSSIGPNALADVERVVSAMESNPGGQAINVVSQARNNLYNLVEDAQNDPDLSAEKASTVIDGVTYEGFKYSYTDSEGDKHSGFLTVLDNRAVSIEI